MAENRKKKNQQKLPWWLTPVLLLAVLAIRFGGEALGRGFQWLSDSQTSESSTTAQKVPSDETLTVRFLDVGQGDSILLSCGEDTMLIDGGPVEEGQFLVSRLNRLDVTELTYVVNTRRSTSIPVSQSIRRRFSPTWSSIRKSRAGRSRCRRPARTGVSAAQR